MNAEYGDSVKVVTKDRTYEGILIPRPEILDENFIILKLDNGYNIGIEKKKIQKIEVAKKYQKKKEIKAKLKHRKELPTVPIISFGGTISSRVDYRTGGVYADYTAEDFAEMMPELSEIANIKAEKAMSIMSEDLNPEDWSAMARRIALDLNQKEVVGVVATHGTDTLHFSTAAMSFFLRNLNKPVVFTAAQRSIDRGSSDAFMNLTCAVNAAAKFDGAEVVTCLHGTVNDDYCILNRGSRVRKMHTSRRDAFRPINELPLAKIRQDGNIEILNSKYKKKGNNPNYNSNNKNNKENNGKVAVDDVFEPKTGLIYAYPGMNPEILDFYLEKKYKGIVIAATALGHVATVNPKYSLIGKIEKLIENGIAVVISSQSIYGRTHPYVYTNLRKLSMQLNCIFAEDILPETAYVKLGWVLGHTNKLEEVKKMMLTNYAGEITERSDANTFLI